MKALWGAFNLLHWTTGKEMQRNVQKSAQIVCNKKVSIVSVVHYICNTNLHMWVWSCSTFQRPDRPLWCLPLGCSLSGRWSYTKNQRRRAPGYPYTSCCPEMETKWGSTFLLQLKKKKKTFDNIHIHVKSTHNTLVYNDSSIISMWWVCMLT